MEQLLKIIADHFGISVDQLQTRTTNRQTIEIKRLAIYFLCQRKYKYTDISQKLGYRYKSTINYQKSKAEELLSFDPWFIQNYTSLNEKL